MESKHLREAAAVVTATALSMLLALPTVALAQAQPVKPLPAPAAKPDTDRSRTKSIPAKGLFAGEQLSASGRAALTDLIIDALGLDVEVALVIPTGPWRIEDGVHDERSLTPKRLDAVRKFLHERGIDPKRVFVESRTDAKLAEPRLDVQLVGRPATN